MTKFDSKIRFYAAIAKRVGSILFYDVLASGNVSITVSSNDAERPKMITSNKFEDLKPYLMQPVLKEIENANKKRKTKKKTTEPETDELVSEINDLVVASDARMDIE